MIYIERNFSTLSKMVAVEILVGASLTSHSYRVHGFESPHRQQNGCCGDTSGPKSDIPQFPSGLTRSRSQCHGFESRTISKSKFQISPGLTRSKTPMSPVRIPEMSGIKIKIPQVMVRVSAFFLFNLQIPMSWVRVPEPFFAKNPNFQAMGPTALFQFELRQSPRLSKLVPSIFFFGGLVPSVFFWRFLSETSD